MNQPDQWKIYNPAGKRRVLVTKMLPAEDWLNILAQEDCKIEIYTAKQNLSKGDLQEKIGKKCDAVIGQLTEDWDQDLFRQLRKAGGKCYCNYAVGYNNVDVQAATQNSIAVGNTPGVLTETTAEMAMALSLASARRIVEADNFVRQGKFKEWLPDLYLGNRLWRGTVGIIGAGRIGSAYALMMIQAFKMDLLYYSNNINKDLEKNLEHYNEYLVNINADPINFRKVDSLAELLENADVVSLHTPLKEETHHLITAERLSQMKTDAILINTSRGPVIDEKALARHCKENSQFKAGLDVFEEEPTVNEDLKQLKNVTLVPHIGSATHWTRAAMARLAALNITGVLKGYPLWEKKDMTPFLKEDPPRAIPSILNYEAVK